MTKDYLSAAELAALQAFDTPTICNALELVTPERRGFGYTTSPLVVAHPDLPPMVGYARTATIKAKEPSPLSAVDGAQLRLDYYKHMEGGSEPGICVIEDIDDEPGYGAHWGEVQTNIHKGLGCLGVVTNGSVRDIPDSAPGFQMLAGEIGPSHAFVYVVDYGLEVTVAEMTVRPGDLIHADMHGAVVIPSDDVARKIPAAVELISRREAVLIGAAQADGFNFDKLAEAIKGAGEIH
jgi:regulator of RNase E activity RraA